MENVGFDSLLDRFENDWKEGRRPSIEETLQAVPEDQRSSLLKELIQIELWWRRSESPNPSPEEYRSLLPGCEVTVMEAFELFSIRSSCTLVVDTDGSDATISVVDGGLKSLEPNPRRDAGRTKDVEEPDHVMGRLGKYELLDEIARGGMGVVYRARQIELNRIVALKMILSGRFAGPEEVARFKTEAEAAANLDHPGIVPIFEIGKQDDLYFFSMGFVEGSSLADQTSKGPLAPRRAAEILLHVAEAIAYAHERGVIHRDLKPANVLIDRNGLPRITDFGLARRVGNGSELTATGQVLGTPSYMPPEQARGEIDEIGPAADVFSLGAILYCMLTGRPPFQAATVVYTLKQVLEQEPTPPSNLVGEIPRDLETICLKCLQKSADRRYPTAADLAAELKRYLDGKPILARPISTSERLLRWCKRQPARAALVLMISLLVLLLGIGGPITALHQATLRRQSELAEKLAVSGQEFAQKKAIELEGSLARSNFVLAEAMAVNNDRNSALERLLMVPSSYRNIEWHLLRHELNDVAFTLYGHTANVESVGFSPDGTRIVSGGYNGIVKIWDAISGEQLSDLVGHTSIVSEVAYSSDGRKIVSSSFDQTIKVWDAVTGEELRTITETGFVKSFALSPDEKLLVSVGGGNASGGSELVSLWDMTSGTLVWTAKSESGATSDASFSPDGSRIVSGHPSKSPMGKATIKVWETTTGTELKTIETHNARNGCVEFSRDGKLIAAGNGDETTSIWDVVTAQEILRLGNLLSDRTVPKIVRSVCFSPDNDRIAIVGSNLTIWDLRKGQKLRTFYGHTDIITDVDYSADGRRVASSSFDGSIKIWDLLPSTDASLLTQTSPVRVLEYSPDARSIAVGNGRVIQIWDTLTKQSVHSIKAHDGAILSLRFSDDGSLLVSGSEDQTVKLWDTQSAQLLKTFEGHAAPVTGVDFCEPRGRIVSGSHDATIRIWEPSTGECVHILRGHTGDVRTVKVNHDRTRIVSCGADQFIRLWDALSGQQIGSGIETDDAPEDVSFSPDGTQVAGYGSQLTLWDVNTGLTTMTFEYLGRSHGAACRVRFSPDSTRLITTTKVGGISVWDVKTGKELKFVHGHNASIHGLCVRKDGSEFSTGGWNGRIRFWNTSSLLEDQILGRHEKVVMSLCLSPDDSRLASGGFNDIKMWDLESGEQLTRMSGHSGAVISLVFSPDGKRIASASWDRTVRIWDAANGRELQRFDIEGFDSCLVFSKDGTRLLRLFRGGNSVVWDVRTGDEVAEFDRDEFSLQAPRSRTADGRWMARQSGKEVSLLDRARMREQRMTRRKRPNAAAIRTWHRNHLTDARSQQRWFSVAFHLASLLEQTPTDNGLRNELKESCQELREANPDQEVSLPAIVIEVLGNRRD